MIALAMMRHAIATIALLLFSFFHDSQQLLLEHHETRICLTRSCTTTTSVQRKITFRALVTTNSFILIYMYYKHEMHP